MGGREHVARIFRRVPGGGNGARGRRRGWRGDERRDRPQTQATLAQRARRELYEFLVVASYLFVCFGALIFYKASILHGEGIEFTVFGLAIVKALILGKFLLLLEALKIGEDKKHARSALANILTKSSLFSLLLFAMTVVEELIVGHFHGRASREVLREIAGGTWQQAVAVAILLFLILIPFFGYQEIAARLGKGKLSKLLTERPRPEGRGVAFGWEWSVCDSV